MIVLCLMIWLGITVGMPVGYFVICGLGIAVKVFWALISVAMKAEGD